MRGGHQPLGSFLHQCHGDLRHEMNTRIDRAAVEDVLGVAIALAGVWDRCIVREFSRGDQGFEIGLYVKNQEYQVIFTRRADGSYFIQGCQVTEDNRLKRQVDLKNVSYAIQLIECICFLGGNRVEIKKVYAPSTIERLKLIKISKLESVPLESFIEKELYLSEEELPGMQSKIAALALKIRADLKKWDSPLHSEEYVQVRASLPSRNIVVMLKNPEDTNPRTVRCLIYSGVSYDLVKQDLMPLSGNDTDRRIVSVGEVANSPVRSKEPRRSRLLLTPMPEGAGGGGFS